MFYETQWNMQYEINVQGLMCKNFIQKSSDTSCSFVKKLWHEIKSMTSKLLGRTCWKACYYFFFSLKLWIQQKKRIKMKSFHFTEWILNHFIIDKNCIV